jgi:hypothetical protein
MDASRKNFYHGVHGVSRRKRCFRIKTPWYANRRFDVTSVVNSYFSDSPHLTNFIIIKEIVNG